MFKKLLFSAVTALFVLCESSIAQEVTETNLREITSFESKHVVANKLDIQSDEAWWGYFNGNYDNTARIGRGSKTEIPQYYDAATCFSAGFEFLKGKEIRGISFSFPSSKNIKDVKVWIANEYPHKVKAEEVAVRCQNVETITGYQNAGDMVNEVRFDKPYFVDPSKDVFIGYSFTVVANEGGEDKFPIFFTGKGTETHDKGLLIRMGDESNLWKDCTSRNEGDLAIRILVSGDIPSDAASISKAFTMPTVLKNTKARLPLEMQNVGTNSIKSLEFSVNINGEEQTIPVTLDKNISGLATKFIYNLDITLPEAEGFVPVTVKVSKVNGKANVNLNNVSESGVVVLSESAEKRVVFEEFTSMDCGYCPRGMVAMENLRKDYGDKVVLISDHIRNDLMCNDYKGIYKSDQGTPTAHVDRDALAVEPYYGSKAYGEVSMGIKMFIDKYLKTIVPVSLNTDAQIDGNTLNIKTDVNFMYSGPANYALAYVVTEDGLHDKSWMQSNYYSGQDYSSDPLLDELTKLPGMIRDYVYDDVAVAAKGIVKGIEGSVPESVLKDVPVTHETSFNLGLYPVIQDKNKLKVCAILFEKNTGVIVNADCFPLSESSAVEGVDADDETSVETARYTIDGRLINSPERGINIVKYSDGSTRKIVVF